MTSRHRLPPGAMVPALRLTGAYAFSPRATFPQQRRRLELVSRLSVHAPLGTRIEAFRLGGVGGLRVAAPGVDPGRIAVHFHGGGYAVGSPTMDRAYAAGLSAAANAVVLLPDYRLAPEHPYPAALDDATWLWHALLRTGPHRTPALLGDSAGAGLAVATAVRLREAGDVLPVALGLVTPFLDLSVAHPDLVEDPLLSDAWLTRCATAYAGCTPLDDPGVSPLHADLTGLPPIRVVSSTHDPLCPDADRFVERARAAGVRVERQQEQGLWHDFALQAGLVARADEATAALGGFLARTWAGE